MNKEISFFDLDGTIWNLKDDNIWIIDKEKPYKPLLNLSRIDFSLIKSGKFKNEELPLDYNGNIFYINRELFDKIKKKSGSENIERFGISFTPQTRKEVLDKKEIEILKYNIEHWRYNKFNDIGILTARSNQKNHSDLINELRIELRKIDIEINKIFFVGNSINFNENDLNKTLILLEHLVGLKIKNGQFVSIKQDWYKKVNFYDDDYKNISTANNIQTHFEDILRKTDDEIFNIIIDRLKNFKLTLNTNLITNNELNKFKKNTIVLREPIRFPLKESLILNYKNWLNF